MSSVRCHRRPSGCVDAWERSVSVRHKGHLPVVPTPCLFLVTDLGYSGELDSDVTFYTGRLSLSLYATQMALSVLCFVIRRGQSVMALLCCLLMICRYIPLSFPTTLPSVLRPGL